MKLQREDLYNRDLSWLSFNYRVLQEAKSPDVPLIERLKFLAIYSSNLDEFYRVRVAAQRHLMRMSPNTAKDHELPPEELIKRINRKVDKQQNELGEIYRGQIIPELARHNIFLVDDTGLTPGQRECARNYFKSDVHQHIKPVKIDTGGEAPFLHNKRLYFAVRLEYNDADGNVIGENLIVNIPTDKVPRFFVLPCAECRHLVIQLDDIMRLSLDILFPGKQIIYFYSVKLSRDAELYLEDEFSEDVVDKIKKSLKKRETGIPSRFLYDQTMPRAFLDFLARVFDLEVEDLVPGGRYHNFSDYFSFPAPDLPELFYEPFPPLSHPALRDRESFFEIAKRKDTLFHFPYQAYDPVIRFIEEASMDPGVEAIKITLYRVASDSGVAKALIVAAKRGVEVTVFDEVKARFDEEANIYWGDELSKAGARVMYSYEQLKVHSKLCLVLRRENGELKRYAFLSSGNFNEKTARIYCDHGLLTADQRLTVETGKVFDYLENQDKAPIFDHLLVAPFDLRPLLESLIENEIKNAKQGKKAAIIIKVNSLEDKKMIKKLYKASNAGVHVRIVVRGICCLIPGKEGLSKNIKATSIVDRFLEHARVFIFHNNGDEKLYVASADWMKRNLSRRVEVAFPIYDPDAREEIMALMDFQLKDNTKARIINKTQSNPFVKSKSKRLIRTQYDTYNYIKKLRTIKH